MIEHLARQPENGRARSFSKKLGGKPIVPPIGDTSVPFQEFEEWNVFDPTKKTLDFTSVDKLSSSNRFERMADSKCDGTKGKPSTFLKLPCEPELAQSQPAVQEGHRKLKKELSNILDSVDLGMYNQLKEKDSIEVKDLQNELASSCRMRDYSKIQDICTRIEQSASDSELKNKVKNLKQLISEIQNKQQTAQQSQLQGEILLGSLQMENPSPEKFSSPPTLKSPTAGLAFGFEAGERNGSSVLGTPQNANMLRGSIPCFVNNHWRQNQMLQLQNTMQYKTADTGEVFHLTNKQNEQVINAYQNAKESAPEKFKATFPTIQEYLEVLMSVAKHPTNIERSVLTANSQIYRIAFAKQHSSDGPPQKDIVVVGKSPKKKIYAATP